jgi:hypothetical protein
VYCEVTLECVIYCFHFHSFAGRKVYKAKPRRAPLGTQLSRSRASLAAIRTQLQGATQNYHQGDGLIQPPPPSSFPVMSRDVGCSDNPTVDALNRPTTSADEVVPLQVHSNQATRRNDDTMPSPRLARGTSNIPVVDNQAPPARSQSSCVSRTQLGVRSSDQVDAQETLDVVCNGVYGVFRKAVYDTSPSFAKSITLGSEADIQAANHNMQLVGRKLHVSIVNNTLSPAQMQDAGGKRGSKKALQSIRVVQTCQALEAWLDERGWLVKRQRCGKA